MVDNKGNAHEEYTYYCPHLKRLILLVLHLSSNTRRKGILDMIYTSIIIIIENQSYSMAVDVIILIL